MTGFLLSRGVLERKNLFMIKKLMIGFTVVITTMFVLGIQKVSAADFTYLYDSFGYSDSTIQQRNTELLSYLKTLESDNYVFAKFSKNGAVYVVLVKKETNTEISSNAYLEESNLNGKYIMFSVLNDGSEFKTLDFNYMFGDYESTFNEFKTKVENNNYKEGSYDLVFSTTLAFSYESPSTALNPTDILYTNFENIVFHSDYELIIHDVGLDDNLVNDGDVFPTYDKYLGIVSTSPTTEIEISYITNEHDIPMADIFLNFENFDSIFTYEYSFNGTDYITIPRNDIDGFTYNLQTFRNGTIYTRIKNFYGDIVFQTSKDINMIIDAENINYYEIDVSKLYDVEDNRLKYVAFFFETVEGAYLDISITGQDTNPLPLYIKYDDRVFDKQRFLNTLDFDNISCTSLPFEYYKDFYVDTTVKFDTAFVIAPCINLKDTNFSDYTSEKIVIRTNLDLNIADYIIINSTLIPTTGNASDSDVNLIIQAIETVLNPILEKMPFIDQLGFIYDTISYDYGTGELPSFTVDLSFLGVDQEVEVIDFSYFFEYRDYIFFFEKLFLGFYTFIGVLKSAQKALE